MQNSLYVSYGQSPSLDQLKCLPSPLEDNFISCSHVKRADCLLSEAAHTHTVNEEWEWWMADKFACMFKPAHSNLPAEAHTAGHSPSRHHVGSLALTYDNRKRLCTAYVQSSHTCTYISLDYTVILGVPILPIGSMPYTRTQCNI